jgi:hypothetical protein
MLVMNTPAHPHHVAGDCPNCGSVVLEFIGHYVALEGKLWKSLLLLLFRPGQLTLEYINGRRVRYAGSGSSIEASSTGPLAGSPSAQLYCVFVQVRPEKSLFQPFCFRVAKDDRTCCSASSSLPERAWLVTAGCEASGRRYRGRKT